MSDAGAATFNDKITVGDGKLVLNSTAVTSTAAELNLLDGVSGLVQADLTKLAALDVTAAELNLLDDKDATHLAVPGKLAGTNFANSLLIGHTTTGTLNDAENNTGVGISALDALTSGNRNTYNRKFCCLVLQLLVVSSNTYMGYAAGTDSSTTASENTAVGDSALQNCNHIWYSKYCFRF